MIADGEMLPVGQQGILGIAEHFSDIGRVLLARIEIDIVSDFHWKQHLRRRLLNQHASLVPQIGFQQPCSPVSNTTPEGLAQTDEIV